MNQVVWSSPNPETGAKGWRLTDGDRVMRQNSATGHVEPVTVARRLEGDTRSTGLAGGVDRGILAQVKSYLVAGRGLMEH